VTTPRSRQTIASPNQPDGGDATLQAYTVEQVAKMLHISRDKVYYLLRTRQLRSIKIGKSRRITNQHLAEFIASLEGNDDIAR
jgi:excisionase family DNA binding protein